MKFLNFDEFMKENKDKSQNHWAIWQHPSRVLVIGGSNCGKTNAILNVLTQYAKYDKLHVYTASDKQDKYRFLEDFFKDVKVNMALNEDDIEDNEKEAEEIMDIHDGLENLPNVKELDPAKKHIVLFDDLNFAKAPDQQKMLEYFSKGRHNNVTPIYIAQSYFNIPKAIRLNASHIMLYDVDDVAEMREIAKKYARGIDFKQFKKLYEVATKEPYCFLFIDKTKREPIERFRQNFDGIMPNIEQL